MAFTTSRLSFSTIAAGIPGGPESENQVVQTSSG
jgi:hypothetical protein